MFVKAQALQRPSQHVVQLMSNQKVDSVTLTIKVELTHNIASIDMELKYCHQLKLADLKLQSYGLKHDAIKKLSSHVLLRT